MFSNMIKQLKEGNIPSLEELSVLLKVALIKKQGVLQQPPACWSNDPKITRMQLSYSGPPHFLVKRMKFMPQPE